MKLKIFNCQFPIPWTLRVSGMGCYTWKCEKIPNHCTLIPRCSTALQIHYMDKILSYTYELVKNFESHFRSISLIKKELWYSVTGEILLWHALGSLYQYPNLLFSIFKKVWNWRLLEFIDCKPSGSISHKIQQKVRVKI